MQSYYIVDSIVSTPETNAQLGSHSSSMPGIIKSSAARTNDSSKCNCSRSSDKCIYSISALDKISFLYEQSKKLTAKQETDRKFYQWTQSHLGRAKNQ